MRRRWMVSGVLLLVAVSACGGSPSDPEPAPTRTPDVVAPAEAVRMDEGRDFDVVGVLPQKVDGLPTYYEGVASDGLVYGRTSEEDPKAPTPNPGSTLITAWDDVVLVEPESGDVTHVSDGKARERRAGASGIDANEHWVVWLEWGENYGGVWTLYSYDRSTGKEHRLGSDRDAFGGDGDVDILGNSNPRISGERVVMSTTARGDEVPEANQVLSSPLDGSAPLTELVAGATSVDADAGGITYVDAISDALTFQDTTSDETKVLDDGRGAGGEPVGCRLFHTGVLMTCEESQDGWTVHLATDGGKKVSFGPFDGEIGYEELDDGWARFVVDPDDRPTIYAINTKSMKLFEVAKTQGGWDLMGHGTALVWPFDGAKGDTKLIRLR